MTAALRVAAAAGLLLAGGSALAEAKKALGPNDRVDLNKASLTELMRLPGVGEKRAQAILAARARQPFKRPEDVLVVKGIGKAWLARVRGNLLVSGAPATPAAPAPGATPVVVPAPASAAAAPGASAKGAAKR